MKFLVILISLMLSAFSCFAQETVDITIMDKKEGRKVVSYPIDTKKFSIGYGSYAMTIEGLEKLPDLETIELIGTAFITDLSFIGKCQNLKHLVFWDDHINDFSFLSSLRQLEVLTIETCNIKSIPDVSHMEKLRYFSLKNCGLSCLEGMKNLPKTLEILNLARNKISSLDGLPTTTAIVILTDNPLKEKKKLDKKKYIFSSEWHSLLPEKFRQYTR